MTCDFHLTVDWRNTCQHTSTILGGGGGGGAGLRVGSLLSGFISSHNLFTLLSGFGTFEGSLLSVVYDS